MQRIILDDITFHYDNPYAPVFDGLSLAIDTSWRTALTGPNGRGKTTVLRLLAGELQPVRGTISMPLRTSYFPYQPVTPDAPTLDVITECVAPFREWERTMEQMLDAADETSLLRYGDILEQYEREGGYDIEARIERETADIGLDTEVLHRPFSSLSGGQQTRALIVALFLKTDIFPLLDEPTNHLDMQGRALLGEYLARKPGFILVSHDRALLDRCANHIVAINRNDVRVMQGSFSQWKEQMELEEEHERRRTANLQREIHALEEAAQQRRNWSFKKEGSYDEAREKQGKVDKGFVGRRAADHMKRALGIERRIESRITEKKSLLGNVETERQLKLQTDTDAPDIILSLENITVRFGEHTVLDNVSLRVRKGDRIAVVGPNGCGKTTLLRAAFGELPVESGTVYLPSYLTTARAYQHPLWATGFLREHLATAGFDETLFRTMMGCFGVTGTMFDRPLETFSFGQRKKVDLCRSFLHPAHLLVWDEPMNYIDLLSRESIEEAVRECAPTLLFVEHDRTFVENVATSVIELG